MSNDLAADGGDEAERADWVLTLNLSPAAGERRVVDGLAVAPGTYTVWLEPVDGVASAYRVAPNRKWLNQLFVLVTTGEEIGRQTLTDDDGSETRDEAQREFNGPNNAGRSFVVSRSSNIFFHPVFAARGNEGHLRLRIRKVA